MSTLTTRDPRTATIATLILVFLCGGMVGALAMNMGFHKGLHRSPFWTDAGKSVYMERIKKDLDLTPEQAEQMASILDDFSKYYRNVLSDGKARIFQILNPEQRKKFEQLMSQERKP